MKIISIVGTRPQFIKSALVSRRLRIAGHKEILVHTGQHYDEEMSQIFFKELELPEPDVQLQVGSGTHAWQTGTMMIEIEKILLGDRVDRMLVYGDCNTTLAGALAACKLKIPIAHVEAGLRSFNRAMPEEHNRILTDHCSNLLFCPTQTAVNNLSKEGIEEGVHWVGDTMYDAVLKFSNFAEQRSDILKRLGIRSKNYLLVTLHRPEMTDNPENLNNIMSILARLGEAIVFPVHPRTRKKISELSGTRLKMIKPVGYLNMLVLEKNARAILTDSGGVQKEAYFLKVPCLTLRSETEWIETIASGWNTLVGKDGSGILVKLKNLKHPSDNQRSLFGNGRASERIVDILTNMV